MKKIMILAVMICGLLVFSGSSFALSLLDPPFTDVGSVDILLDSALLANSGDQTEVNWINSVLGTSFTTADMTKYDTPSGSGWLATDEVGKYAIDFQTSDPEYFFIKTGNLGTSLDHFLYQNIASFAWGVIDFNAAGVQIQNVGKLSHIGEIGGGGTQVPEPTTLLLLGLGLVGLVGLRRKMHK